MGENIARVIKKHNPYADVARMALMLYGLPNMLEETDAFITVPGLGEWWRVADTIRAWECDRVSARHLLIAGQNENENCFTEHTIAALQKPPYELTRLKNVHTQIRAENTKVQAEWIVRRIKELKVTTATLFAPPYHLLRVYGTILKEFYKQSVRLIPIMPAPLRVSPVTFTPETNADQWVMATGEIERIIQYQDKGDVATFNHFQEYLAWLYVWKRSSPKKISAGIIFT